MSDSESRLVAVEAHLALMEIEGAYAVLDSGDAEGWPGLFTSDGVFEMASRD